MYAIGIGIRKAQHRFFCSRLFIQSNFRQMKFAACRPPTQKVQKQKWWGRYIENMFGKYLLITNTVSSGVLLSIGDLTQQQLEYYLHGDHKESFNWKRNMNMGIVGIVQGPLAHYFYSYLDERIPGVTLRHIGKKIFIDQLVSSPVGIVTFFLGMNFLDGMSYKDSRAELSQKFWVVYAIDCLVWIPAQFINFYWITPQFRVLYINVLTMCYNIFLSFIKHVPKEE